MRRLWRVNCEALVTAAGHNLQQLLKKRGWGRHPFPTEAVASAPPNFEPDETFGHDFLKSKRPSVAVASLVTHGVLSMGSEFQICLFSLTESYSIALLASIVFPTIYRIFIAYSDFVILFPSLEMLSGGKLSRFPISLTRAFSTG